MKVGFTGTQEPSGGWTQLQAFTRLLACLQPTVFVHGDCIGWDAIAAMHVAQQYPNCAISKYPSTVTSKVANAPGVIAAPPQHPLQRNWDIVKTTWLLVACPRENTEQVRSGTWSTIRKARAHGKPVFLVMPDGSLDFERVAPFKIGNTFVDLPKLVGLAA